ncbi:hypothetical protein C8R43DRAFT_1131929 [Mycena crocata]|nr:hypothetical protein C8R43DRAFT_1131929 [Mycena crocata]
MALTEPCAPGNCARTFSNTVSLIRHRRACEGHKIWSRNLAARRKELATASKIQVPFTSTSTSALPSPEPMLPPPAPLPPQLTKAGRPARNYRLPAQFEDILPEPPAPVAINPAPPMGPLHVILHVRDTMRSACNCFGIFREYLHRPSYNPDALLQSEDLAKIPATAPLAQPEAVVPCDTPAAPWPFRNMSIYRLMHWANSGSNSKSEAEVTRLVADVIAADDFRAADLAGFNAHRENKVLDDSDKASAGDTPWVKDGWVEAAVDIPIPSGVKDTPPLTFSVPGLHYRPLVEVIKAAFAETMALKFHLTPFKRFQTTTSGGEERVYDEVYTSDAWLDARNTLQKSRPEPGCKLERIIAGLMCWSDSTHLANFGTAKAWPLYIYFANLSKYICSSPTSGACHQVAYFPSLPDTVYDFISKFIPGKTRRNAVVTHCRRELMHQVWKLMLDDAFVEAYQHGIVVHCIDGVWWRVYPRIFTYSADYPEKVLLATIRDKGYCPCPRCLVHKSNLSKMGLLHDLRARITCARIYFRNKVSTARDLIYKVGLAISNGRIDMLLQEFSLVPTLNTFGEKLGRFEFNFHTMLVVDHLHEWSLGNIIPCVEGLLPEPFNSRLMTMLFRLSEWNAFAKMRMHTETTLGLFETSTTVIGRELRSFASTTQSEFKTVELPGETASRARRGARKKAAGKAPAPAGPPPPPKGKFLNLNTYKFHALGDYAPTIRVFGSTELYSTQTGELVHKDVKVLHGRTNKNNATKQMVRLERRATRIRRAQQAAGAPRNRNARTSFSDNDHSSYAGLDAHHHMSTLRKDPIHLLRFVQDHSHDPATKGFIPKLKDHLLSRLLGRSFDGDEAEYSEAQHNTVKIIHNTMFPVQTLRVNFTTYDMWRDQDTINPRSHPSVMVLSPETTDNTHPFWYARVLGIYHVEVLHTGSESRNGSSQHMEFLWVRWYGTEPGYRSGFKAARLPKIGFVPDSDEYAFGFLDPSLVLCGCHIVPAFAAGRTSSLSTLPPGQSTAARAAGETDDWENFYVVIWVDRDMFMRYVGNGVGHLVHRQLAWKGNNDADVNGLADAEEDAEAPPRVIVDDAMEVDLEAPAAANNGDSRNELELEEDSDRDSDAASEMDCDSDDSSDEDTDDDDEDGDIFDDEGFLDI